MLSQVASVLIGTGKAGKVLLVSAISGVDTSDGAVMASLDDLAYKFAGLTVTVCATATILGPAYQRAGRHAAERPSQGGQQPCSSRRVLHTPMGHSVRSPLAPCLLVSPIQEPAVDKGEACMRKRRSLQGRHSFTVCPRRFVSIPEPDNDWHFGEYNTAKVVEKLVNRTGTAFGLSQFMFKGRPEP